MYSFVLYDAFSRDVENEYECLRNAILQMSMSKLKKTRLKVVGKRDFVRLFKNKPRMVLAIGVATLRAGGCIELLFLYRII